MAERRPKSQPPQQPTVEEAEAAADDMPAPMPLSMMTDIELRKERSVLESKSELHSLQGSESERLDEVIDELNRRQPSYFKVTASGQTVKMDKGPKMAMFDPAGTGLGNATEPQVVEEGEYKLCIVAVYSGVTKTGKDYWQPSLEIVDHPHSKDFTHYLVCPDKDKMSEKEYRMAVYDLQVFMDCFSLPYDRPFNPAEEWPGSEGWWIVGKRGQKSDQYGEQNFLTRGGAIPPR